jgi:hypothetical protein
MMKNVLAVTFLVELLVGTGIAADFDLYAIGDINSQQGSRILRYAPSTPANPIFGLFEEVILEDKNIRTDLETDGNSLFSMETLASSGRNRIAKYSTDGVFLEEIADISFLGNPTNLIRQDGNFYATGDDEVYRIENGTPSKIGIRTGGGGMDAFPGGFISTGEGGIRIFDESGFLLSQLDLELVLDAVAIDDANSIAYLGNLSSAWVVVDFSDPHNPTVLSEGTAADALFLSDFDPNTGNIFGTSLGVVSELSPDGSLVTRYVGDPSPFKLGVAVIPIPEPASSLLFLTAMLALSQRHRG